MLRVFHSFLLSSFCLQIIYEVMGYFITAKNLLKSLQPTVQSILQFDHSMMYFNGLGTAR